MNRTKFECTATRMIAVLLLLMFCFTGHGQTANQAWLKYRPTGKPLNVPTNVRVLGRNLWKRLLRRNSDAV